MKIGFEKDFQLDFEKSTLKMIWVSPTKSSVGVPKKYWEEKGFQNFANTSPEIEFELTNGYWISQYPVTQQQYQNVKNISPKDTDLTLPQACDWREIIRWCYLLNRKYEDLLPKGYYFSLPSEIHLEIAHKSIYSPSSYDELRLEYWHQSEKTNPKRFYELKELLSHISPIDERYELRFPAQVISDQRYREYCFEPFYDRVPEGSFIDWNLDYQEYFDSAEAWLRMAWIKPFSFSREYISSECECYFRISLRKIEMFDLEEPQFLPINDDWYKDADEKEENEWKKFSQGFLKWLRSRS